MSASTVNTPQAASAATSTFDNFKTGVLQAVNWMGRQIQWLGSTIRHYAIKAYEFVKPFFESIGRVLADGYAKARDLAIENKEVSITLAVLGTIISAIALGTYFFPRSETKPADGATAPKPA